MSVESLVLDSQGFALWIDQDRKAMRLLEQAERDGVDVAMSAATVIEVSYGGVDMARLNWLLSRIRVEAVTKESARRSARLLKGAGLHGHKYAIDAMLAATALAAPGPVTLLTSDPDDLKALCGREATIVEI